jgi:hypothetical protein
MNGGKGDNPQNEFKIPKREAVPLFPLRRDIISIKFYSQLYNKFKSE